MQGTKTSSRALSLLRPTSTYPQSTIVHLLWIIIALVIITFHHCFAHHLQTTSTKTSHFVNMPTNMISGLVLLLSAMTTMKAAAEESSTTVHEIVLPSETPAPVLVSNDPSLVDDTLFKNQMLSGHNVSYFSIVLFLYSATLQISVSGLDISGVLRL